MASEWRLHHVHQAHYVPFMTKVLPVQKAVVTLAAFHAG